MNQEKYYVDQYDVKALIGSSHKKPLTPGWYDVQFSYAVCGKKNDIIDKGAFCIREKNNN